MGGAAADPAARQSGSGRLAGMTDALADFSVPTGEWFRSVFEAPTTVQIEAWAAIAPGV